MHLVDAIRKASQQATQAAQDAHVSPPPVVEEPTMQPEADPIIAPDVVVGGSEVILPSPVNHAVASTGGSVVRLELFLSPEQMHMMLRGILQGAHTVMTLREASKHLRIPANTLLELAESGDLPAFLVDGQWKFPRQALDEWITLMTLQRSGRPPQEVRDVA